MTHSCFPSYDHLLGFPHPREGTKGWTLDTTGCGFPLRWVYTGSQAPERLIPLAGKTGKQFCNQGSEASCLDTDGSRGEGTWVNPQGHPGLLPASYVVTPCYDIKRLDCEAPVHLYHCSGDQCHYSGDGEGPSCGIRKDYQGFHPSRAREVNGVSKGKRVSGI